MTIEEVKLLDELLSDKEPSFDFANPYSDEFYDEFIKGFCQSKNKKLIYRAIKRIFDIIFSFVSLLLLLIPFVVISCVIKCDSYGPAIFKHKRIGKGKEKFVCLKFRSMLTDAPAEIATSTFTEADKYITRIGKFLRKTSMDELPQLFNVLSGKMSLVGYRPLIPSEEKCNDMRAELGVFDALPGITGLAQVNGRDNVYYKNKAIMDAYYVKNASLKLDIKILFNSVKVVFNGDGNNEKNRK